MKYNFCTLFDSYYLTRGIALYKSLELYCEDFHIYIFAFDERSDSILRKFDLKHATIISLKEFENEELIRVKPTRTIAEYCWTATASTIWYSIHHFNLDHCTYLDADILFFSSLSPIFEEIGSSSIAITPHNFAPKYKSSKIYGKYCVQFTYFRNDKDGIKALEWWKNSTIEWCYAKLENGKYGDQKYLDSFEDKFNNVCVISNLGVGVAPWNISEYIIELFENRIMIDSRRNPKTKSSLIFYHYQGLKFIEFQDHIVSEPSLIKIEDIGLKYIYLPYINMLTLIKDEIDGTRSPLKSIIFKKNKIKSIGFYFRVILRKYRIIQTIYYLINRTRYNRPKEIGGSIKLT